LLIQLTVAHPIVIAEDGVLDLGVADMIVRLLDPRKVGAEFIIGHGQQLRGLTKAKEVGGEE
jgi:hypothetical protein